MVLDLRADDGLSGVSDGLELVEHDQHPPIEALGDAAGDVEDGFEGAGI